MSCKFFVAAPSGCCFFQFEMRGECSAFVCEGEGVDVFIDVYQQGRVCWDRLFEMGIYVNPDFVEKILQTELLDFFVDVFCEKSDEGTPKPVLFLEEGKCRRDIKLFQEKGMMYVIIQGNTCVGVAKLQKINKKAYMKEKKLKSIA